MADALEAQIAELRNEILVLKTQRAPAAAAPAPAEDAAAAGANPKQIVVRPRAAAKPLEQVSDIPHQRDNPVQRPNTAEELCSPFDLAHERGWLAVQNIRNVASHYEYEWLAPTVSYLSDTLAAFKEHAAAATITDPAEQKSLAVIEAALEAIFRHVETRLDMLKIIGQVGQQQPGLISYIQNETLGPLSKLPVTSPGLTSVVSKFVDRQSAAALTSAANRSAAALPESSGNTGGTSTETPRKGGGRSGGPPPSPAETRSRSRGKGRGKPPRDPSLAPSERAA